MRNGLLLQFTRIERGDATPPCKRATKTTIGGVAITADQVTAAVDILTNAAGIMVRQPLAKANHPLASCDYHAVANAQRQLDGDTTSLTKSAFIRALEGLIVA